MQIEVCGLAEREADDGGFASEQIDLVAGDGNRGRCAVSRLRRRNAQGHDVVGVGAIQVDSATQIRKAVAGHHHGSAGHTGIGRESGRVAGSAALKVADDTPHRRDV